MGDVFSGGQLLTAAIALYCTMAALRSNDRGRDKHRHAGTLFLDSPRSAAPTRPICWSCSEPSPTRWACSCCCTTGLFDTTALAEFPLVIRLRNDADLRAGLRATSAWRSTSRPGLPQPPQAGEAVHSEITATRMFEKPA